MGVTAEQLINLIKDNDLLEPLFHGDLKWAELDDEEGNPIENVEEYFKNLFGELEYKDGRCDTSEFWQVIYFKDCDIYLEISGEYDSYGQGEHQYYGITEVRPKEITKTVYTTSK